jgi:hypothetical protein
VSQHCLGLGHLPVPLKKVKFLPKPNEDPKFSQNLRPIILCPIRVNEMTSWRKKNAKEWNILNACQFGYPADNSSKIHEAGGSRHPKFHQSFVDGCCVDIIHISNVVKKLNVASALLKLLRFEVFTAVTMKNGVFWDVTPCGSCKNRRFGGTWLLLHQGDKNRWTRKNASCN